MPTGYTDGIKIDTPFQDFALQCARAFGALIERRDEPANAPIPDEFTPSNYHLEKLEQLIAEQDKARTMTLEQAVAEIERYNADQVKGGEEVRAKSAATRARYERMLNLVSNWQPPTAEHQGLQDFMVQQITDSIKWDCHDSDDFVERYYAGFTGTPAQWIAQCQEKAAKDIEYHKKHYAEDCERARSRTAWVKALRESLASYKG